MKISRCNLVAGAVCVRHCECDFGRICSIAGTLEQLSPTGTCTFRNAVHFDLATRALGSGLGQVVTRVTFPWGLHFSDGQQFATSGQIRFAATAVKAAVAAASRKTFRQHLQRPTPHDWQCCMATARIGLHWIKSSKPCVKPGLTCRRNTKKRRLAV